MTNEYLGINQTKDYPFNTVEHVYNEIQGTEGNCLLYPSFVITKTLI